MKKQSTAVIAENIKCLRLRQGIRQEYIAECVGVSQSIYSRMESGQRNISKEQLALIAKALRTTLGILAPAYLAEQVSIEELQVQLAHHQHLVEQKELVIRVLEIENSSLLCKLQQLSRAEQKTQEFADRFDTYWRTTLQGMIPPGVV